ncbi:MAG: YggT family protein [Geodermatophilaceae bacterium]|nr:YggT family protein [Geodermatophilaceae bacterium]
MSIVWQIVAFALLLFLWLLLARLVMDWVMMLSRGWRPGGGAAASLEVIYSSTDPPLKLLRRVLPPLNLGSVKLDLGFMVLLIVVYVLREFTLSLAY